MRTALTREAGSLWAKAEKGDSGFWLPLFMHMSDSAATARRLWRRWLPNGTKEIITEGIQVRSAESAEVAETLAVFLAAAHDVGKATPAFQGRRVKPAGPAAALSGRVAAAGLPLRDNPAPPHKVRHPLASQMILARNGFGRGCAVVAGGHHGTPPSVKQVNDVAAWAADTGFDDGAWRAVQDELLAYALRVAGADEATGQALRKIHPTVAAQVVLTGLVIMADWLASDEKNFPYIEESFLPLANLGSRAEAMAERLPLPERLIIDDVWKRHDLYRERFTAISPHPVQAAAAEAAGGTECPGLMIIEAPMGEGKTEAALAVAEIFAQKSGSGGLFFALPTQATADGIFPRVSDWIGRIAAPKERHVVFLAHGKSHFNKEYRQSLGWPDNMRVNAGGDEGGEGDDAVVHAWFMGRKKGLLSEFVIGTVDQVLMGGLRRRHLALRHLGLANKVIVIDECHAYDAYMGSYLDMVLRWLGTYRAPVIVLSATLPSERRKELVEAYTGRKADPVTQAVPWKGMPAPKAPTPPWASQRRYPLITYTDGEEVKYSAPAPSGRALQVDIVRLHDDGLIARLESLTDEGGCVGIVMNTVARAQQWAERLSAKFGAENVRLLHSRLIGIDRIERELEVRGLLGREQGKRPHRLLVVGTQVMEQSLDVDFDMLVTDLCPIDLLLQRLGRLHRHHRPRPRKLRAARCLVLDAGGGGFEKGAVAIYGKYLLMTARQLLPDALFLPGDIPGLVQQAYGGAGVKVPDDMREEYDRAKAEQEKLRKDKEARAKAFQIGKPDNGPGDLVGWLELQVADDASGKRGEAAVRDTQGSLEVIVIQRSGNRDFRLLPLPCLNEYAGRILPRDLTPDDDMAFTLAGCAVNLPRQFTVPGRIDRVIRELESGNASDLPRCWQESPWLRGELFLLLDEGFTSTLDGSIMRYDEQFGLRVEALEAKHG